MRVLLSRSHYTFCRGAFSNWASMTEAWFYYTENEIEPPSKVLSWDAQRGTQVYHWTDRVI